MKIDPVSESMVERLNETDASRSISHTQPTRPAARAPLLTALPGRPTTDRATARRTHPLAGVNLAAAFLLVPISAALNGQFNCPSVRLSVRPPAKCDVIRRM